ncbi:MAG: hypothetical protein ACK5Y8_01530 [Betaproteobacteria bacterium]
MDLLIEHQRQDQTDEQIPTDGLFQVWIDSNCGIISPPDWDWNSPPQALPEALVEAADCRRAGFPAKVMPEGMNPRPDGRWD